MSELAPLDPYFDDGKRKVRHRLRSLVTRPVISTLLRTTVLGEENIEELEPPFIVVPNHSSHLDAPMVFSLLPDKLTENLATGAAADYFYRKPTISKLTSAFFNTYPVVRRTSGVSHEQQASARGMTGRLLSAGIPILIFPEGTRSRTGKLGTPKAGAAALSQKYNAPIVPIAMPGNHDAMPVGKFLPKPRAEVALFIGAPMTSGEDESADDFMSRVFDAIEQMLEQKTPHPTREDGSSYFDAPE